MINSISAIRTARDVLAPQTMYSTTPASGASTTGTSATNSSSTNSTGSSSSTTANDGSGAITAAAGGAMGETQFVKLLVTEMQNQDPLNPMDGKDLAVQLAQFSSVEQLMNVNTKLDGLTAAVKAQGGVATTGSSTGASATTGTSNASGATASSGSGSGAAG